MTYYNGHLPQVVLGEDAQHGGAYDLIRGSKRTCILVMVYTRKKQDAYRRHAKERFMNTKIIIRAWKNEEYRLSLSEAERRLLPENPAGAIDLSDAQLDMVAGGGSFDTTPCTTSLACPNSCGQKKCGTGAVGPVILF